MNLGLKDAKVLVTAASQGLGAAAARQFAREGAQVAICARNEAELKKTAEIIQQETGHKVHYFIADVSQAADVQTLVDQAAIALGGLDILVCNSGGPSAGKFETVTASQWEAGVQVTLMSTVNMVKAALPYLKQSKRAAILAVTSISVRQPIADLTLSNSIRLSVVGLMKSLANEYGPLGIRTNSILPGWTRTARVDEIMVARAERNKTSEVEELTKQAAAIPLGRIAEVEEFANVAVFICSPAASFVNGVALAVDGGATQFPL